MGLTKEVKILLLKFVHVIVGITSVSVATKLMLEGRLFEPVALGMLWMIIIRPELDIFIEK